MGLGTIVGNRSSLPSSALGGTNPDRGVGAASANRANAIGSDGWVRGSNSDGIKPIAPRYRMDESANAGANAGYYSRAVSAAMLGVTSVGALVASPVMAEAPLDLAVVNVDMPTFSIEDLNVDPDPVTVKADRVMDALAKKIEAKSRVTARDLANGNSIDFIEGRPGFRKLSEAELLKLVSASLKDMPLGALPAGSPLAKLIEALPGFDDQDVSTMSYNEIRSELKDDTKEWFDNKFGETIKEHRLEAALLGVGGVAALRSASPEARDFINKHAPTIKVWKGSFVDGRIRARTTLKYRGDDLMPNLDLSISGNKRVGDVKLRSTATTTLSLDNAEIVKSRLSVGARIGDADGYGDASAWVNNSGRYGTRFELGRRADFNGMSVNGRSRLDLGPGTARDPNADGRLSFELEAAKTFRDYDNNVRGSFGLFGSHSVDTNGGEKDSRVGVTFRWTW
jgi:hypothetical protein